MNDFPGSAGKDMLFLRSLSSVAALYTDPPLASWRNAHQDLQQFLDRNSAYEALYVHVDTSIDCTFEVKRTTKEGGNTSCSDPDGIIEHTLKKVQILPHGSVYVSPLSPYTMDSDEKKIPALLYGTRVSAPGTKDGAIVAVVNANYFLEEVRRLARPGEAVYLVNTDGSYIAHPESGKEMIAGGMANFYEDFRPVSAGTLSDGSVRTFDAGGSIFTFKRITPTASNFALYDGAKKADVSGYWVLVAVSEKNASGRWFFSLPYLITVGVIVVAHLLVIALLFLVLFPRKWRLPSL